MSPAIHPFCSASLSIFPLISAPRHMGLKLPQFFASLLMCPYFYVGFPWHDGSKKEKRVENDRRRWVFSFPLSLSQRIFSLFSTDFLSERTLCLPTCLSISPYPDQPTDGAKTQSTSREHTHFSSSETLCTSPAPYHVRPKHEV